MVTKMLLVQEPAPVPATRVLVATEEKSHPFIRVVLALAGVALIVGILVWLGASTGGGHLVSETSSAIRVAEVDVTTTTKYSTEIVVLAISAGVLLILAADPAGPEKIDHLGEAARRLGIVGFHEAQLASLGVAHQRAFALQGGPSAAPDPQDVGQRVAEQLLGAYRD